MERKRHYLNTHIAGFTYWQGAEVFNKLSIGVVLRLERDLENKHDPYAVAIYFEDFKLGYIPRTENKEISKFLEMGYTDIFETRINRVSKENLPELQIGIVVHLKRKE